jgi:hypothetical protein
MRFPGMSLRQAIETFTEAAYGERRSSMRESKADRNPCDFRYHG